MDGTWIQKVMENIPFTLGTLAPHMKVNKTRIVEALIIGAITGLITSYMTLVKMEVMIEHLKEADTRIEAKVDRLTDKVISAYFSDSKKGGK